MSEFYSDGYSGSVSMMQVYQITYWLQFGIPATNFTYRRIPKVERDYLIEHYKLIYSEKARRYVNDREDIFEILKKDYPIIIHEKHITSYDQLLYMATKDQKGWG